MSRHQSHDTAGRFRSIDKCNGVFRNGTRDLVPQVRYRVLPVQNTQLQKTKHVMDSYVRPSRHVREERVIQGGAYDCVQ
jgi:hypothetical protein